MIKNPMGPMERASLYEALASCYLQLPNHDRERMMGEVLEEFQSLFPHLHLQSLIEECKKRQMYLEANADGMEDLEQLYYDHFFVPTTKNYIPPFESAVREAKKINSPEEKRTSEWKYASLWGSVTHHVIQCYRTVDFEPSQLNIYESLKECQLPDHIGFELAFMAYLCHQEALIEQKASNKYEKELVLENKQRWNNLQSQFLKEHLQPFIKAYYSIAVGKADSFYRELARAINYFIYWDLYQDETVEI